MFITEDLKLKDGYIYILSSRLQNVLYIGVTSNLRQRIEEHQTKKYKNSFTAKYNCSELIYYEHYGRIDEAIRREKQLKKWNRAWKLELIQKVNPEFRNLFEDFKSGVYLWE